MDIQLPNFNFTGIALLLFSSFIFLLIKACKIKNSKSSTKYEKLPPSPPRLPVFGHFHHLLGGGLPHCALARLTRKFGPILHLQLGEVSTVVISSPEAAKEVLKVQDPACTDRPANIGGRIMWYDYKDIAFCPYDECWKQMRKIIILEMLSAKNVKGERFGSIRQDEVFRLVKSLQSTTGENSINLTQKVSGFTSSMVSKVVFGEVPSKVRETLVAIVANVSTMATGFELADFFPSYKYLHVLSWNKHKLLRMHNKLDTILDLIIEEHKLKRSGDQFGGGDIVDVLLRMKESGGLNVHITNDNIKAVIFDMFVGATESTVVTVDWAMSELMRNPRVMAKVQTEVRQDFKGRKIVDKSYDLQTLKYLNLVIKETLRLHPPTTLIPRKCRLECRVDGYLIPLKSKVMVNVWSMARDPKYWHEPESFQPERFENSSIDFLGNNFEYLPFGAGKRMCPGMDYGLTNVTLVLAQLLYHFDWKMPKGMTHLDLDMTEKNGISVSRKNDLFLVPIPYNASTEN